MSGLRRQYGVQIEWMDPIAAGADPDETPRWSVFDSRERAESFGRRYELELGKYRGTKAVRYRRRWALEVYSRWRS